MSQSARRALCNLGTPSRRCMDDWRCKVGEIDLVRGRSRQSADAGGSEITAEWCPSPPARSRSTRARSSALGPAARSPPHGCRVSADLRSVSSGSASCPLIAGDRVTNACFDKSVTTTTNHDHEAAVPSPLNTAAAGRAPLLSVLHFRCPIDCTCRAYRHRATCMERWSTSSSPSSFHDPFGPGQIFYGPPAIASSAAGHPGGIPSTSRASLRLRVKRDSSWGCGFCRPSGRRGGCWRAPWCQSRQRDQAARACVMMAFTSIAPMLAPLIAGQILWFLSARRSSWVLAGIAWFAHGGRPPVCPRPCGRIPPALWFLSSILKRFGELFRHRAFMCYSFPAPSCRRAALVPSGSPFVFRALRHRTALLLPDLRA